MAKSFQEGHTARLVHTVHENIHSTGAAWGGRHSLLGVSLGHTQSTGEHMPPSGTLGWSEGHREACSLASASLQSRESLRMALS